MADYEQIMKALRNAHAAGDTAAANRLARMAMEAQGQQTPALSSQPAVPEQIGTPNGIASPSEQTRTGESGTSARTIEQQQALALAAARRRRAEAEGSGNSAPPAPPPGFQTIPAPPPGFQYSSTQPGPASPPPTPAYQREIIATTRDGGEIHRMEDGTLAFTSPGYSTTDPATVERLMQGAQPVEIVQDSFDNQRIDEAQTGARANELVRGIPFVGSYADEAMGAVSPGRADNMRQLTGAMQRQRPGETMALNVTGAVAGSVPMAMAAAPSVVARAGGTVGTRFLQGAGLGMAVGGTEGAVYGAGEGQGAERGQNAVTGGAIGAAAGAVAGGAAPYLGAGIRNVLGRLRQSDVGAVASTLGVSRPAAAIIRDALQSGDMQAAEAALQRAGGNAMLADAGQPARQLLDASAAAGGGAGQTVQRAVAERTQTATERMTAALDRTLGSPQGERELIDSVRTGTQPARNAAYDAAYAAPIDYSSGRGRAIEGLLRRVPASAVRRAEELMRLEGVESSQILARIDGERVTFEQLPDVRQLDYITRALNDVAANADGAGKLGGTTDLGRATSNLSRSIRQTLRGAVPEYGQALDTAADAISQRNAIETGYSLLRPNTRREDVARSMAGASQAERAAARQGLRSYIDDTTANVARTITDPDTTTREGIRVLRDFSSRANQTKMRILLGERQANELMREIDEAATAFELRAAIAENSKTAVRQSIQGGVDQQASQGIVRTLAAGEPVNATKRLVQALTGETAEAQEVRRLGLYQEIASALTTARGPQAQAALRVINNAMQGQQITNQQARLISAAVTSGSVLTGGRAASLMSQ